MRGVRIAVIGTGYLGCLYAVGMAEFGFETLGFDVDEEKIALLSSGHAPIFEPGLDEPLSRHVKNGRLRFTGSAVDAAEFGDVVFICAGTPQRDSDGSADMRQVNAMVDNLIPHLQHDALVVVKSTVPVGTSQDLLERIRRLTPSGISVDYAFNPEFLREGSALHDTLHPDRIVLGLHHTSEAPNARAEQLLREVYRHPIEEGVPLFVTDFATAELVKTAANSFLATKISFINMMADLCDVSGADVTTLAAVLGADARIGPQFLEAGIGYGGGCIPKDLRGFMARAGELGVSMAFLHEIDAINIRRRLHAVDIAGQLLDSSPSGRRIAVLGAAFKPHSDDVRDSPALAIAGELHLRGAQVVVFDPQAMANARISWPTLRYAQSVEEACDGSELVILGTQWPQFCDLDPTRLRELVDRPVMFDGRNALDPVAWRTAGWTYRGIGRP